MQVDSCARPVRFLLVEDDEDHADLVRRSLRDNNVLNSLEHAANGEEAMAILRHVGPHADADRPDVILLDLKLPRKDGHEVLAEIKADPSLADIPVVVLTTSEAERDIARAYAAHANSYLVKPVDFDQFHRLILDLQMYWAVWNRRPQTNAST